jgi:hypothetical protein
MQAKKLNILVVDDDHLDQALQGLQGIFNPALVSLHPHQFLCDAWKEISESKDRFHLTLLDVRLNFGREEVDIPDLINRLREYYPLLGKRPRDFVNQEIEVGGLFIWTRLLKITSGKPPIPSYIWSKQSDVKKYLGILNEANLALKIGLDETPGISSTLPTWQKSVEECLKTAQRRLLTDREEGIWTGVLLTKLQDLRRDLRNKSRQDLQKFLEEDCGVELIEGGSVKPCGFLKIPLVQPWREVKRQLAFLPKSNKINMDPIQEDYWTCETLFPQFATRFRQEAEAGNTESIKELANDLYNLIIKDPLNSKFTLYLRAKQSFDIIDEGGNSVLTKPISLSSFENYKAKKGTIRYSGFNATYEFIKAAYEYIKKAKEENSDVRSDKGLRICFQTVSVSPDDLEMKFPAMPKNVLQELAQQEKFVIQLGKLAMANQDLTQLRQELNEKVSKANQEKQLLTILPGMPLFQGEHTREGVTIIRLGDIKVVEEPEQKETQVSVEALKPLLADFEQALKKLEQQLEKGHSSSEWEKKYGLNSFKKVFQKLQKSCQG